MKKMVLSILALTLTGSSGVFAAAVGTVPRCTSGAVNIEIYNKNLLSDDCYSLKSKGKYCIYDLELFSNDHNIHSCVDYADTLTENLNESYSLSHANLRVSISHYLYTKGGPKMADLHFIYDNGSFTNNCAEVFGPDVKCVTTVSGSSKHRLYKVTISRNS